MTKVATRSKKLSGVIAFEDMADVGFCRKTVTVTLQAGMDLGAVLHFSGGKYVWVQQSTHAAATDVCVLIDATKDIPSLAAVPADYQLAVLYRGQAGVVDTGLMYKDALSGAEKLVVQGKLETKLILTRTAV
jgi:hypothetical protein